MRHTSKVIYALGAALLCLACSAPQTKQQQLDAYFDAIEGRFMGSILIRQNDQTIYQRSMGYADIASNIRNTDSTQYRIGSITKTFTTVLTLKAAAEGLLSLKDPIAKYFPEAGIRNAELITIDQLLQHRSGMVDITNERQADYLTYYTTPQTREQMVSRIAAEGSNFTPDSTSRYCNAGFMLLTYILEDAYGKRYGELIDEHIARPLGLTHTRMADSIDTQRGDARSYMLLDKWELSPETHTSVPLGAGALTTTTSDLNRFITALYLDKSFGADIPGQMLQIRDGFGRGVMRYTLDTFDGYGHGGNIDGFGSLYLITDSTVVTLCSNGMTQSVNVGQALIEILSGKEVELPTFEEGIYVDSQTLDKYVGEYVVESLKVEFKLVNINGVLHIEQNGMTVPLKALKTTTFECESAGLKFDVDTTKKCLYLKQMGMTFEANRR